MPLITEIDDRTTTDELRSEAKAPLITEIGEGGQPSPPSRTAQRKEPFLPWIEQGGRGSSSNSSSEAGAGGRGGDTAADDFTAASCFMEAEPGYVFKLGGRGLGYYRDDGGVAATSKGSSNAPAIQHTTQPTAQVATTVYGSMKSLAHAVERTGGKLVVSVPLPGRSDTRGVVLAVMGTTAYSDLTLRVEGFDELRVRLPAVVDQKNVKAKFSKASQRLNVQLLVVAECGQSASSSSTAAAARSKKKAPKENHNKSTNGAAKSKEEKPNLDDLKICTQCGGLGQYTDKQEERTGAQDIRCGLQGQRFSGLQRVLTYECPTCEGDGYVNSKKLAAKKASSSPAPEASTAPHQRDIAKWNDFKKGSAAGDAEWEMVDAASSSSSGSGKPPSSAGASSSSAQSDAAAYQAFKDNMEPAKRAEFEKILAEARAADGSS